ncbi:tumor necrosis factor receptor superfamily member 1A [Scomber scombrus]|uniref:tumor necrosis factor receptor superfamily member 1A n=1 Tax=Scomber scombrus TaxID=13677 RepID=UPI002DD95F2C|nr:tumor necrosis factor receptor superfamily member 1A [Scomber scombrus]
MDFVLVGTLLLAFLCIGQSYTEGTEQTSSDQQCHDKCQPGYHSEVSDVKIHPCTSTSDVLCDCKDRYYNERRNDTKIGFHPDVVKNCLPCPCIGKGKKTDSSCGDFEKCKKNPECKRKCISATTRPIPTTTTSPNKPSNPAVYELKDDSASYLILMNFGLSMVIVAVLFWIMFSIIFMRNWLRGSDSCPCWCPNKDMTPPAEDPEFNEQQSHQGCSSTTMTFNSEETPMMTFSQSPEHPAHISPSVADTEHKATRQKEQSEHWPAIVLYAIIKEVPLRRWKEFLRLLSLADQQLERVELEAGMGLGFTERQYQMLRLWSQRSSASLSDIFSALHYMDLSGCAQLLQESLEKLQWQPEPMQSLTACTNHGFSGAMQDT